MACREASISGLRGHLQGFRGRPGAPRARKGVLLQSRGGGILALCDEAVPERSRWVQSHASNVSPVAGIQCGSVPESLRNPLVRVQQVWPENESILQTSPLSE